MINNAGLIDKLKTHSFNTNKKVEYYVNNAEIFVTEFFNLKTIIKSCFEIDKKFKNMSLADDAIYIFLNSKLTTLPQNMKIKVINTIYELSLQQISLVSNKLKKIEAEKKNKNGTRALLADTAHVANSIAGTNPACKLSPRRRNSIGGAFNEQSVQFNQQGGNNSTDIKNKKNIYKIYKYLYIFNKNI